MHALANASGAVAHWGQELRQSQTDIALRAQLGNVAPGIGPRCRGQLDLQHRVQSRSRAGARPHVRAGRRPADAGHVFVAERKYALGLIRDA